MPASAWYRVVEGGPSNQLPELSVQVLYAKEEGNQIVCMITRDDKQEGSPVRSHRDETCADQTVSSPVASQVGRRKEDSDWAVLPVSWGTERATKAMHR